MNINKKKVLFYKKIIKNISNTKIYLGYIKIKNVL
jgi:hypothetical protein